jgi:hypothetical protein
MAPRTGLSVLMNGGMQSASPTVLPESVMSRTRSAPAAAFMSTGSAAESNRGFAQEMMDRERQASSLAAAGMVADSVSVAARGHVLGLQAPPPLATGGAILTVPSAELDSINWNLDPGIMYLDDMDLDFAQLFDTASEVASMQTDGSGWPTADAPSKPPPTAGNTKSS